MVLRLLEQRLASMELAVVLPGAKVTATLSMPAAMFTESRGNRGGSAGPAGASGHFGRGW